MDDSISPREFHESEGVEDWRLVEDGATAFFPTPSLADSLRFVQAIGEIEGVGRHPPDIDIRRGGVTVRLMSAAVDWYGPSRRDVAVARAVSVVARQHGLAADVAGVQSLLIIPGAPAGTDIVPFWRAVLGYEPRADSPEEDLVDPFRRGASFWFEEMHEPRSDGGGSIHIAVWVPEDQAEARVAAALAAGGRVVRDRAPMWWTLADAAGNEADIATTSGRE